MQRLLLICATLALWLSTSTSTAFAAGVSERRALQPGIWWDDRHPGHGFELQHIHDQLFLLWYTYDEDGTPVWYAAQTTLRIDVPMQAQLLRHQWGDGSIRHTEVVGQISLRLANRESAQVDWQLGTRTGSWSIQPFEVDGVLPEVNHSGLWFQDDRPGYGLSLMAQGQTLIAALFMYDANGQPTWRFGNAADGIRSVPLDRFRGQCPGCTASVPVQVQGDPVQLELTLGAHERELAFTLAEVQGPWPQQGATLAQLSPSFSERAADWQLARFESEAVLKRHLEEALQWRYIPIGIIDFSASPPPRVYAPTNVQESGVDEADLVKTDGNYVYTMARTPNGSAKPELRVARVGELGLTPLPAVPVEPMDNLPELYLTDEELVLIGSTLPHSTTSAVWTDGGVWRNGSTSISVLDRSNPEAPRPVWSARLEGHLLSTRRIGRQLYLVQRSTLEYLPGLQSRPRTESERAHNRRLLDATALDQLLPQARFGDNPARPLVNAQQTYLPPISGALVEPEFITITRIDLDQLDQPQTLAILGQAAAVYVSSNNLYLASGRYENSQNYWSGRYKTDIHQIALSGTTEDPSAMRVVGTGTVEGFLDRDADRAPLRFGEHEGRLNVITVSPHMWGALGRNRLSVLQASTVQPGLLATRAYLPSKARPQPLGKPGEMLYGTRYVGDRMYAVTFLTTDPLYSVDLSNPDDPRILGELEIPGFSEYLHPLPNGLMLGLGMDAAAAHGFAWFQGLQLSLFDVNGAAPRELQRMLIGRRGSNSAALRNHRAFADLALPGQRLLALPARIHDSNPSVPANPPADYHYPHAYSGLLRFTLTGSTAEDARLAALPPLLTRIASTTWEFDDSTSSGRPVLFEHGAVYVDNGQFYWISNAGAQTGPL